MTTNKILVIALTLLTTILTACGNEEGSPMSPMTPDFETMTPAEVCEVYDAFGDAVNCVSAVEMEHMEFPLCRASYNEEMYWEGMADRAGMMGDLETREVYEMNRLEAYAEYNACLDRNYPIE